MRDPREIYPNEPISSILNRLHQQGSSQDNSEAYPIAGPLPSWLRWALLLGIPAFGIAIFTINRMIDARAFG